MTTLALAATDPDRVRSLFLYATAARFTQDPPGFPWGFTHAQVEARAEDLEDHWGEGTLADLVIGAAADVPGVRDQWGRIESSPASPTMAALLWRTYINEDVRDLLGRVTVPTLVAARPDDRMVPFEASAALADALSDARLVMLPPGPHAAFDIVDMLSSQILDFCERPSPASDERVLVMVLFTDIVGSTEQLGAAGDQQWSRQLNVHDDIVDRLLSKYGGRRVNHTGDGVFALSTCRARRLATRSSSCRHSRAMACGSGPVSTSGSANAAATSGRALRCTPAHGYAGWHGAAGNPVHTHTA